MNIVGKLAVLLRPGSTMPTVENVLRMGVRRGDGTVITAIPLFTGEEKAEQFLLTHGDQFNGTTIYKFADPSASADLISQLERSGVTHVSFNPARRLDTLIPIGEVATHLRSIGQ